MVGLMTNFLTPSVQHGDTILWGEIPRQSSFWVGTIFLFLGIFYQKSVYQADTETRSVLEESKEGLAESLGAFYADKIASGDIDELEAADKKLRKIFRKDA
jgi:hypothetical protein